MPAKEAGITHAHRLLYASQFEKNILQSAKMECLRGWRKANNLLTNFSSSHWLKFVGL